jgi:hypothetical protein
MSKFIDIRDMTCADNRHVNCVRPAKNLNPIIKTLFD